MAKVIADALYNLPQRGYMTLQIPTVVIDFEPPGTDVEYVDVPDDYVETLNSAGAPAKDGILYWTPKGYAAHKEQIHKAYEDSPTQRGSCAEFEAHVAEYFATREKRLKKLRNKLTAQMDAVTAALLR